MAAIFEIANEDFELIAIPTSGGIGDPTKFDFSPNAGNLSEKLLLNNKKALIEKIEWIVKPETCTMPGFTHLGSTPDTYIEGSTTMCLTEDKKLLLKLDMGICQGNFANNANGLTVPCSCQIMIKNAGQEKVKGS